jgi:dCMP deaminase
MSDPRISFNEYAMIMAKIASMRSGCNSRPSGAVIVMGRQIIATGYNGPMPGQPHCVDHGPDYCFRRHMGVSDIDKYNYCRASHAEANAISQAAKHGVYTDSAVLYCTLSPCLTCTKLIVIAGIVEVYYELEYSSGYSTRDDLWFNALSDAGVPCYHLRLSDEAKRQAIEIITSTTSKRRLGATL